MIDDALEAGHVVYLHCRAGIGRSATVAGCWLASRSATASTIRSTNCSDCWQQCAKLARLARRCRRPTNRSRSCASWARADTGRAAHARSAGAHCGADRTCARRAARPRRSATRSGRHAVAAADGRRAGRSTRRSRSALRRACSSAGASMRATRSSATCAGSATVTCPRPAVPRQPTPDVAKALANYQWRGQPMAGSHDPRDRTHGSPAARRRGGRFLRSRDPGCAVRLAGECARTTHQSPFVLDACRYYGAMLVGALRGAAPRACCAGLYEPVAGSGPRVRSSRPCVAAAPEPTLRATRMRRRQSDAGRDAGRCARAGGRGGRGGFRRRGHEARDRRGREPAPRRRPRRGAGRCAAWRAAIPPTALAGLARLDLLERFATRLARRAGDRRPFSEAGAARGSQGRECGRKCASRRGRGSTTRNCSTCASATCG